MAVFCDHVFRSCFMVLANLLPVHVIHVEKKRAQNASMNVFYETSKMAYIGPETCFFFVHSTVVPRRNTLVKCPSFESPTEALDLVI